MFSASVSCSRCVSEGDFYWHSANVSIKINNSLTWPDWVQNYSKSISDLNYSQRVLYIFQGNLMLLWFIPLCFYPVPLSNHCLSHCFFKEPTSNFFYTFVVHLIQPFLLSLCVSLVCSALPVSPWKPSRLNYVSDDFSSIRKFVLCNNTEKHMAVLLPSLPDSTHPPTNSACLASDEC